MKEHPILFKGDMVRATLEDRKTETRRIVKPQPTCSVRLIEHRSRLAIVPNVLGKNGIWDDYKPWYCPYGQVGDRLWVRETFCDECGKKVCYRENMIRCERPPHFPNNCHPWKPSIHMFHKYSRITLEITEIRVERVQDMTNDDCIAEGIHQYFVDCNEDGYWDVPAYWYNPDGKIIKNVQADSPIEAFSNLWDSINAKRGYPWDSNPWVWVIKFKVIFHD